MNTTTARSFVAVLALAAAAPRARGADLMRVLPVNDTVLMLHFDEGHIDYGPNRTKNTVYRNPLDVSRATAAASYRITSEDDARFAGGVVPVRTGRKAKSLDINNMYHQGNKYILEHWVYLVLPRPLARGRSYTVSLPGVADNMREYTFLFDERRLRSESVHVNLVGYRPDGVKHGYVSHWMGDMGGAEFDAYAGAPFHVVRYADGAVVHSGVIAKRKDATTGAPIADSPVDGLFQNSLTKNGPRNFVEADVWECDFSSFATPGEYVLSVERVGCSFPFRIGENVYRDAYHAVSKGIFLERAGIEKQIEKGMTYPRGHHPADKLSKFYIDTSWRWIDHGDHNHKAKNSGTFNVWGWYHDAGDWDGYARHIHVSYSLLLLYDLVPENFSDGDVPNRYRDNATGRWYDEGTNGVPDVLDEAAWLVRYYRRTRAEGLRTGLATGGVPGAYSGADGCSADMMSWRDNRDMKFSAEDPATTYNYAAAAAWLAACLDKSAGGTHPESRGWLDEAKAAYAWAKENTRPGDPGKVVSQRFLAAAALYRSTKDVAYQADFAAAARAYPQYGRGENAWFGPGCWELAVGIYGLLPDDFEGLDVALRDEARAKIVAAADLDFTSTAAKRGYRVGFDWHKLHMCGTMSTPEVFICAIAYKITGDRTYLDNIDTTTSFYLGGNPMNMTWITGLGARHVRFPFHPDSWNLYAFHSKVYSNEIILGLVPFGSWQEGDFFGGTSFGFTGDEDFSHSSAYPKIARWPIAEMRFGNRFSISGSEFTVSQNLAPAAFAYGFLSGKASRFTPNERPTVRMTYPADGDSFRTGSDIPLRVDVSDDTRTVEYYYEEHFIGETSTKPFSFVWKNAPAGEYTITAKPIDDLGRLARPNDPDNDVDVKIRVAAGADRTAVERVAIVNAPRRIQVNTSYPLCAECLPLGSAGKLTWSSSRPDVVSVNREGVLYARARGSARITVEVEGAGRSSCRVSVVEGSRR